MAGSHDSLGGRLTDWVNTRIIVGDLERALARRGRSAKIKVDLLGDSWPNDIAIDRTKAGYRVTYPAAARRRFVMGVHHFLGAYLYWMDLTSSSVERMTVNCSDGDRPSRARFAASARPGVHVTIPDPHFFLHEGFHAERALAADAPAWADRSDEIVWRGGGNGAGLISLDPADHDNPTVIPRLRLCMKLRSAAGCDVRVVDLGEDSGVWTEPARQMGLAGSPLPASSWLGRKYAIDIDGQVNTWSNLFTRMLFGCCVLKVESPMGFQQWYYDRIKPFEHYVPVRADMSDLVEMIEWTRSHPVQAEAIAAAGRAFALALDWEAGKRDAVDIITANWRVAQAA